MNGGFEIDRRVPKIEKELGKLTKEEMLKPTITEVDTRVTEEGILVIIKLRNENGTKIVYSIKEKGATIDLEKTEEMTTLNYTFTGLQNEKEYEITIEAKNEKGEDSKIVTVRMEDPFVKRGNSLIEAVKNIQDSGFYEIKVNGKTEQQEAKEVTYNAHVITVNRSIVLNGTNNIDGATLANNTYEFGDKTTDVGDIQNGKTYYARNMVILKVEGDLTINQGVTLTACKSDNGYGGPKGMLIYCTGKLTNNGTISMTARGAKAEGEDVYLWKNANGTYEYVPAIGGNRW